MVRAPGPGLWRCLIVSLHLGPCTALVSDATLVRASPSPVSRLPLAIKLLNPKFCSLWPSPQSLQSTTSWAGFMVLKFSISSLRIVSGFRV
ncbi:hypothetical protein M758_4G013500 [Ceratodon purpureus]|uniref:Secreted protein n=1 Tax=Ceratodon purpureus TaxID=3225 RepID=A0A8T0I5P3_CERPU|nr:hypothetical protein KC19_4G014700 [Ceratodon purpureus]KAG0617769.1 hypothetical protein M758_4G013500 [Ceratodon purpureus]